MDVIRMAWPILIGAILASAPPAAAQMFPSAEDMKEMQESLKQAQDEMQKLDPATRAQIDQILQNATGAPASDSGTPPRNAKALAASKAPLSGAALKRHVDALQPKIAKALAPALLDRAKRAEAIAGGDAAKLAAAANALAAAGSWPEATYLIGKAAAKTGTAEDLNTLAAFLAMLHAESAALPILYTLDARYPGNSTILNNLGEALYGLGDLEAAKPLLLKAVARSATHPQANATLARIHAAAGDPAAAQAALHKAIQGGYSDSKEEQLRQSGGALADADVHWTRTPPEDAMGFSGFVRPAYPQAPSDLPHAIAAWHDAAEKTWEKGKALEARLAAIPASSFGARFAALKGPLAAKATQQFRIRGEFHTRQQIAAAERIAALMVKQSAEWDKMNAAVARIDAAGEEKYRNVAGGYQYDYTCKEVAEVVQGYISATVPDIAAAETAEFERNRKALVELVYLAQFLYPASEFERYKLSAKASFLGTVSETRMTMPDGLVASRKVCFTPPQPKDGAAQLPDFDDLRCDYVFTANLGVGTITSRCDKLEADFDPGFGPLKASWETEIDDRNETNLRRASVEIETERIKVSGHGEFDDAGIRSGGVGFGVSGDLPGTVSGGPLEIGVSGEVGVGLEFDRSGITDVRAGASAGAKASSTIAKTDAGGQSQGAVAADVGSSWSWNSGYTGTADAGFTSSVFDL